ncbi:MAG TPA: class I SAM-dependent methyltransferase [Streptosporangiaceae bacterium]|nr:class I SAM-dependent methyltransferase [Streptosporangiaceae bacterium]
MMHGHGREGHHDWDARYAAADRIFPAEPDEALVELAAGLSPGRALDLGAGEGRNSLWLARQGWQVTAVDLSEVGLGRLRAQAAAEGLAVEAVTADMGEFLARGGRFDLVVVANIHPAAAERARLLAAAAQAVAHGGHLFLTGHHLESLGRAGPPDPDRLYTEDRLAGAFPGLEVLRIEKRDRQRGDAAAPLVNVVAWAARPVPAHGTSKHEGHQDREPSR